MLNLLTIADQDLVHVAIKEISKVLVSEHLKIGGDTRCDGKDLEYLAGAARQNLDAAIACAFRAPAPVELQFLNSHSTSRFSGSGKLTSELQQVLRGFNVLIRQRHNERIVFEFTRCGVSEKSAEKFAGVIAPLIPAALASVG